MSDIAADSNSHPERVRKTISLSHKQVGISATVAAVLYALQPILAKYQTIDVADAKLQTVQVQLDNQAKDLGEVKNGVKELSQMEGRLTALMVRISEAAKAREVAAEGRQRATDERQDRHIEMLEASRFGSPRKGASN